MKDKADDLGNPNVILLNCCQDMGKRFYKCARSYDKAGDHAMAAKLRRYAWEQFSAVRQVRQELKMAGQGTEQRPCFVPNKDS